MVQAVSASLTSRRAAFGGTRLSRLCPRSGSAARQAIADKRVWNLHELVVLRHERAGTLFRRRGTTRAA